MTYNYTPSNVCPMNIKFDVNNNIVTNIEFSGGCNGNLKALQSLLEGLSTDQIIDKCEGITCGRRPTSCTDQLTVAIKEALSTERN